MTIRHVSTEDLGEILLQLVSKGLTFQAFPHAEGMWTIHLTGGH